MTTSYTTQAPAVPGWYHAIPWEFVGDDDESPMPIYLEIETERRRVFVSGEPCGVSEIAVWGPRIDPPGEPDDWRAAIERAVTT